MAAPLTARAEEEVAAGETAESPPAPPPPPRKKNVIITGSNSGIGFSAAGKLAAMGYNVVLACRTQVRAVQAA